MQPNSALAKYITEKMSTIVSATMEYSFDSRVAVPTDELKQFITGFVSLTQAAAAGDVGPRDEYIRTVIPGVKEAGLGLATTMRGMVGVAMGLMAICPPEHRNWLCAFVSDYTERICITWEKP